MTHALGWYAIRQASVGHTGFASVMLWIELAGVLTVGTLSIAVDRWFPDASVWSDYGIGYGFVPAVLPIAGLLWLRKRSRPLAPICNVFWFGPRDRRLRARHPRPGAAAQPHRQGRHLRGPHPEGRSPTGWSTTTSRLRGAASASPRWRTCRWRPRADAPRADRRRRALAGKGSRGWPTRSTVPAPVAGQVGHAGPVANGRSNGVHAISASRMPSPLSMQMIRAASEADLMRVTRFTCRPPGPWSAPA